MFSTIFGKFRIRLTYTQIIALGFLGIILVGSFLLCLPVSSRTGEWTDFTGAMFTATSATCVTGLIVFDTYTHWSVFGQIVILMLIQIGGLGFMSIITMFSIFLKRRISLHERKLIMQASGTMRISGVVRLMKRILLGTLVFESVGAVLLFIRFYPRMGLLQGIYNAVFHSVSAFCNAGFDIMGKYGAFSSFTDYSGDVLVNLTIVALIVIGGIGFLVWDDILRHKFHLRKYELHSKIVLSTTAALIFVSWLLFLIFERNSSMADMTSGEKMLAALFQAVTPRTAGFNTIDLNKLSEPGGLLTTVLMFIGGSPGSTAGGIKTTTFMVILLGALATSRHSNHVTIFKRRLEDGIVKRASAIFTIYLVFIIMSTMLICAIDPISFEKALFETVSAVGTVGLTIGITPSLSYASRIILMILMFGGRVGGLSLMLVLAEKRVSIPVDRPCEKILIG